MFSRSESKGIFFLLAIIIAITFILASISGSLEKLFGIKWFSGPALKDSIVYISNSNDDASLFSMRKDGENKRKLTNGIIVTSKPAISPNGRKILFAGKDGLSSYIYIISAKGGKPQIFTTATGPKDQPEFSPDGKKASFIASGRVYVSEMDGKYSGQVLPTQKQMRDVMTIGGDKQIPSYKLYRWTFDSKGMVGVTSSDDSDQIIFLPSLAEDYISIAGITKLENGKNVFFMLSNFSSKPAMIEVSEKSKLCVKDITVSKNKRLMFASVNVDNSYFLLAFDDEEKLPPILMKTNKYKFADITLSPDNSILFACFELLLDIPNVPKNGIVGIKLSDGSFDVIAEGKFSNISANAYDNILLSTIYENNEMNISVIDLSDGKISKLTNDGKSYNPIWTPHSEK